MTDRKQLEDLFETHGFKEFKWFDPKAVVVSRWVRMKCVFGCDEYGRTATCPPNVPEVEACREFFREYSLAVVFRFQKKVDRPEDRFAWTREVNDKLLKLERDVFCAGHVKAFLLPMDSCIICEACPGRREKCKEPKSARPTPEALAVDVFSTVRSLDLPIQVLSDYSQVMNRYAFLLIE